MLSFLAQPILQDVPCLKMCVWDIAEFGPPTGSSMEQISAHA